MHPALRLENLSRLPISIRVCDYLYTPPEGMLKNDRMSPNALQTAPWTISVGSSA
jgi:hypothetical protein